jgi:hypothetical protein
MTSLEQQLGIATGTIKAYVLIEQVEASYQLMEIRAALGLHFAGFNTGRWDYINSVSDAVAWDPGFINPNIDAITMTYGYMRTYEDRVRRAVNTPDLKGQFALWQGGMEPNIPVGSEAGVTAGMKRATAGAEREPRGRERQVGRPLEDGPHRPAGLGESRRRESARSIVSETHLHGQGCRRSHAARTGAAHDSRRARSDERSDSVRQRVRPGPAGRGAQARGLLRQ